MSMNAIELTDVVLRWPSASAPVLDIERFVLHAEEMLFLRGPSGCGKSTLLSVVAGVKTVDQGSALLLGSDWRGIRNHRRDARRADHVGYIFQQFNLLPYLSVVQNVELPCRFSKRRAARAEPLGVPAKARELLSELGLGEEYWHRRSSDLSVGQQQRVAAARALIGSPEVVIADEPTSALDEDLRELFMNALLRACKASKSALLFVSHDSRLADHFDTVVSMPDINRGTSASAQ